MDLHAEALKSFPVENYAHLVDKTVGWLSGSKSYGMDVEGSDTEFTYVYLDLQSHISISNIPGKPVNDSWKVLPSGELSFVGEDNKMFSFRRFLELLLKGNPNLVEMLYYQNVPLGLGNSVEAYVIQQALVQLKPYVLTKQSKLQYLGHIFGVLEEVKKYEMARSVKLSPKRIAHALRLAYTLEHILRENEIPVWNRDSSVMQNLRTTRTQDLETLRSNGVFELLKIMHESLCARVDVIPRDEGFEELRAAISGYNLRAVKLLAENSPE